MSKIKTETHSENDLEDGVFFNHRNTIAEVPEAISKDDNRCSHSFVWSCINKNFICRKCGKMLNG